MIHNRKARIAAKCSASLETARAILRQITTESIDAWEGYRSVYGVYAGSSGLLAELKPLFQLPGILPDGCMTVDDSVREAVRTAAEQWLVEDSDSAKKRKVAGLGKFASSTSDLGSDKSHLRGFGR